MRYLLEALEAGRGRYPDLQKVYAFASCEPGNEELVGAMGSKRCRANPPYHAWRGPLCSL